MIKNWRGAMGLIAKVGLSLFFVTWGVVGIAQTNDISQDELMQRIKANQAGLILDVRTPEEYAEGHVPGAKNIPHDQLGSRLAELDAYKDKDIVLYCKSGRRAGIAANTLRAAGFSKLLHLDGDMNAWAGNGKLPIKK